MKKIILGLVVLFVTEVLICSCASVSRGLSAQEKIGECKENVYDIGFINNNIPVCFYTKQKKGLVSDVNEYFVQIENEHYGPYEFIDARLYTKTKIFYTARIGNKWALYTNGKPSENSYNGISNIIASNDGQKIAYAVSTDDGVYINYGDKKIGPHQRIFYWLVSGDGEKIPAYVTEENGKVYVYSDSKKSSPFDSVEDWTYASDEKSYAFKLTKDGKQYVYTESDTFGPYDNVYLRGYSSDGTKLAYETSDEDMSNLYVNGKLIESCWLMSNMGFSKDSQNIKYISHTGRDGVYIHSYDNVYGPFKNVGPAVYSTDDKIFAYVYSYDYAPNNKYYLRVGNETVGPYEDVIDIVFSPDDSRVAYEIKENDKLYLMCDGKKYGPHANIMSIAFSNDSKELSYHILDANWKNAQAFINGYKTKVYDGILYFRYCRDNVVAYKAEKNDIWYSTLFINGKEYIGKDLFESFIYIDNGIIYKR